MLKNKRGWIRIVEAFVAVLLIMGVVLVLFGKGYFVGGNDDEEIYDLETGILRTIETNQELRNAILIVNLVPVEDSHVLFPPEVSDVIQGRVPAYLECAAKICLPERICNLDKTVEKDVYAREVLIAANLEIYEPKQLKLFCWRK